MSKKYSILNDIIECTTDFIDNCNYSDSYNINMIREYVYSIIYDLYGKTDYKKYIYIELIEQIISIHYPHINKIFDLKRSRTKIKESKKRVEVLQQKPQSAQRSEQWHKERKNSIGASELASVFNKNPFCSYNKYLLKKSGYEEGASSSISIQCLHGVKYEDVVQKVYCMRNGEDILEFGSIEDEEYSWLRASPDGITPSGTMLEIKVPFSREITGVPPIYYWHQMQQQMKVCKLNQCDFVECKIEEYPAWNDFITDVRDKNQFHINTNNMEKGVIIEYLNLKSTSGWDQFGYIYPTNINTTLSEIYDWNIKIKEELSNCIDKKYARIIPWKITEYSCIRVYRNNTWWEDNFKLINDFWNKVLHYKKVGYESILPKKRSYTKKKVIIEYGFIPDSDTE